MRLKQKFELISDGSGLQREVIDANRVDEVSHRSFQKSAFRYYFEESSSVESPWLSYGKGSELRSFIGAHSYVNNGGYLRDRVLIGRYCSIGRRVTIGAGTHPMNGVSTSPHLKGRSSNPYSNEQLNYVYATNYQDKFTIIESDVWVGDGVIIMPGVTLSVGSVIGANAVVTKNTEPYGIYVGVPARMVGRRFSDELSERLLNTCWWDIDRTRLQSMPTENIFDFLSVWENTELGTSFNKQYITYSTIN